MPRQFLLLFFAVLFLGFAGPVLAQEGVPNACTLVYSPVPDPAISFPFADQVGNWVAPILAGVGTINLALAVPLASIARVLQGIFLQPLLFLFGRRRKAYGTVYDSLSKKPVDLAVVRLISADTGKVMQTKVTDAEGRFTFFVRPGSYRFSVAKREYVFPSRFLVGRDFDENYGRINTGERYEQVKPGILNVNLPMDGPEDRVSSKVAIRRKVRQGLHFVFSYAGIILSAVVVVYAWNYMAWIFLFAHILLFLLFNRLTRTSLGRPWGRIVDRLSRKKLDRAVVRIMDARFNRVLETIVTDQSGQYGFRVGKSRYRVESLRDGYNPYNSGPFDTDSRPAVVAEDISMDPRTAPVLKGPGPL